LIRQRRLLGIKTESDREWEWTKKGQGMSWFSDFFDVPGNERNLVIRHTLIDARVENLSKSLVARSFQDTPRSEICDWPEK
jgi:hypothetical protein